MPGVLKWETSMERSGRERERESNGQYCDCKLQTTKAHSMNENSYQLECLLHNNILSIYMFKQIQVHHFLSQYAIKLQLHLF